MLWRSALLWIAILIMNAEQLAQLFHETYEELAPDFGYKTREASRRPWKDVPEKNKKLMIAVAERILSYQCDIEKMLPVL